MVLALKLFQEKDCFYFSNVNVPLFVNEGEKIKIDTRTNSYVERVK